MAGTLWLVGTPIGNLGDLTERARETLGRVGLIACEDTRRTRALLSHLGIEGRTLVSFFEGNEERRTEELLEHLRAGRDVAVVSDAGMPALSDPGYRLVAACAAEGIAVDAAPGPSAAVTALVLSGLPTDRFAFEGFLPRKPGARKARLRQLATETRTLVVFESARRLGSMLADAAEALGPDRRAAVARELTKLHQDVSRGTLGELAEGVGEVRGEVVVVVGGAPEPGPPDLEELAERVQRLTSAGLSRREAAARVAAEAGASKREVYEASLRGRST
ncbi:MAG: 16S rRNA (cytidine(1402)-2'-O)-methyltransferase [Actinomycetota bacterium]